MTTHNPIVSIPLTYQFEASCYATNAAGERATRIPCLRGTVLPCEAQLNKAMDERRSSARRLPPRGYLSFRACAASSRLLLPYHDVRVNQETGELRFTIGEQPTIAKQKS